MYVSLSNATSLIKVWAVGWMLPSTILFKVPTHLRQSVVPETLCRSAILSLLGPLLEVCKGDVCNNATKFHTQLGQNLRSVSSYSVISDVLHSPSNMAAN